MNNIYDIIISILNAICLGIAMSNLTLYSIKNEYKILISIYIFICQMFLYPIYGQPLTIFCVGGVLIIIAFSNRHYICNLTFSLFGYLLYVLLNHLLIVPLYIFGITVDKLSSKPIADTIFTALFTITVFCATYFLGKYLHRLFPDYNGTFPKSIRVLFLVEVLACSSVYIYNIIEGESLGYSSDAIYNNGLLFSIFFMITITIFLVCLRILLKNHRLMQIQQADKDLMDYMNKLENMYQEMRVFKHDYVNTLSTLTHYIQDDDMENLKQYFETQILPDSQNLNSKDAVLARLGNIKIKELKGLLYSKMIVALNRNLPVQLEIRSEIDSVPIRTLDLCKVIGIFIDNAIEEVSESAEKNLSIAFIREERHLCVVIANSTDKKEINLQNIYKKDVSYKSGHSGLGLYSAKKILNGYGNVMHSTTLRNGIFTQIIDISEPDTC